MDFFFISVTQKVSAQPIKIDVFMQQPNILARGERETEFAGGGGGGVLPNGENENSFCLYRFNK